jgi:pimeloyl-ACP methyl ester carboxylesterase
VVDAQLLERMRSFEDNTLGIRERFVTPLIGGAPTVGVLSEPLAASAGRCWVVVPSFAFEQMNLMSLEVAVARALAGAGFAVLRYHSQGYGDSASDASVIGVMSHCRDARSAAELARDESSLDHVGLLGMRFGGAIALSVAAAVGADRLVLVDPVLSGADYLRSLISRAQIARYGNRDAIDDWLASRSDHAAAAENRVPLDLGEVLVTPDLEAEMAALEVLPAGRSFSGMSLVVQVSRSDVPRPEMSELVGALGEHGTASHETVADDAAPQFGLPRIRRDAGGMREDGQLALSTSIRDLVVQWSTAHP